MNTEKMRLIATASVNTSDRERFSLHLVFEAEEFAQMVDGFSIGSNDLTQLTMGADRDSGILNNMGYFDERNEAVKRAISILIKAAHKYGKTISICGQGPSQYPEFAEFLIVGQR